MTDALDGDGAARTTPAPSTAGGRLREAREAAGWSLEDVAQQLKLATRQVQALENDDWQLLPGRTFIRGFARNYARLMQLDADSVLAMLPASDAAQALERPALAPTRRPMGEIPLDGGAKPSSLRWLLPILLVVVAGTAGFYEYSRQKAIDRDRAVSSAGTTSRAAPAQALPPTHADPTATGTASAPLPNPLAADTQPSAAPETQVPSTPATDAVLVLAFTGTSWAEVKDASGRVILQMTGGAGMTQTVSGTPPFELALGNAPDVRVTFRGQALDLAAYTRGSVARVALK